MEEMVLDRYLRDLKFIVIANQKTGQPIDIFFGFDLPNLHSEIFEAAKKEYSEKGIELSVRSGGRITKKENIIVFHGRSEKYGRYEDSIVLSLAPEHPLFKNKGYVFLSKSGCDNVNKVMENYKKGCL